MINLLFHHQLITFCFFTFLNISTYHQLFGNVTWSTVAMPRFVFKDVECNFF